VSRPFLFLRLQAAHESGESQHANNEGAADSGNREEQLIHSVNPYGFANGRYYAAIAHETFSLKLTVTDIDFIGSWPDQLPPE
jgi:hypothetical protein